MDKKKNGTDTSPKKIHEMENKYLKRTWKMQIKTTMRYHFTPTRMAIMSKTEVLSTGEDVE
jgi:hypothetical protein